MKLNSLGLKIDGDKIWVLDQQLLPHSEEWLEIKHVPQMIEAIQSLKVRGAPLIGVAAAAALGQSAMKGSSDDKLKMEAESLMEARPTAVNLRMALRRMEKLLLKSKSQDRAEKMWNEALDIFREDVLLCENIAKHGVSEFADGDKVLHHCNTGGLATVGIGTALGVLQKVWQSGKKIHVYVDETRPLLQGARLTTWELKKLGIPHTLISDNMAASLMQKNEIQKVILGSDRIAANGDFANKIGTYSVAVLSHYHQIPFYVAAPWTTVDPECPSGAQIPIEERDPREVLGYVGRLRSDKGHLNSFGVTDFGHHEWTPEGTQVHNPSFDVTPAELVTGWITDRGLFRQTDVEAGIFQK